MIRGEFGVPEVWIANGEKGGNGGRADGSYVTEFSHEPLRLGDELVHYYGCSSLGKSPAATRVTGSGSIGRGCASMASSASTPLYAAAVAAPAPAPVVGRGCQSNPADEREGPERSVQAVVPLKPSRPSLASAIESRHRETVDVDPHGPRKKVFRMEPTCLFRPVFLSPDHSLPCPRAYPHSAPDGCRT